MGRPKYTPLPCECAYCGRVVDLSPSRAARFTFCSDPCRVEQNAALQFWDVSLKNIFYLSHRNFYGVLGVDDASRFYDPEDRARISDGKLYIRTEETTWIVLKTILTDDFELLFAPAAQPPETVSSAPLCEVRIALRKLSQTVSN